MLILPLWLTICLNAMAVKSRLAVLSGGSPGPTPPYFQTKLRHLKTEKNLFGGRPPHLRIWMSPPPLSEGLDPPLVPRYNGHPIIWTAAKSQAKMNYRCLTEINSRYYGLSLFKVPIVPAIKGVDCTSADSQENNQFSFEVGVGGEGNGGFAVPQGLKECKRSDDFNYKWRQRYTNEHQVFIRVPLSNPRIQNK